MIQELLVQLYVSIFTVVGFEMLNKNYPYPCNEGILTPAWVEVYDFDEDSTYVTNFRKIVKNKDWEINVTLDNTKKLFRITDNAFGMNRAELEKAIDTHQQIKIFIIMQN